MQIISREYIRDDPNSGRPEEEEELKKISKNLKNWS